MRATYALNKDYKKYKCLKQLEQMVNANPALKQTLKNLLHG